MVTRPCDQAGPLLAGIAAAGGEAVLMPLLEISALPDQPDFLAAMADIDRAELLVFISPNAVSFGVSELLRHRPWPVAPKVAAVGQGTAAELRKRGIGPVIVPETGSDSEALLSCPGLSAAALAGRTVVLFKGEGGRELLADTLAARGARVLPATSYRRMPPPGGVVPLLNLFQTGRLDGIVLSSSEAVRHLGHLVPSDKRILFESVPVFCPHPRIAEAAAAIGCRRVCVTRSGDDGVLAGLSEYNWPTA